MSDEPRYRIQAVADLTGVAAHTLRAWERRYGVPRPERSVSAYRLYSQRDVDQVLAIRALCDQGMSVAEASALAKNGGGAAQLVTPTPGAVAYQQTVERLVAAAVDMNVREIERVLGLTSTLGPPHAVLEQVLRPAQIRVGDMWHRGELSVAHEHLFTELAGATLRDLVRLKQPALPRGVVVLGCFAEEQHTLGMYGSALHLADAGYRTVLLGARTPPDAVQAACETLSPDLVGLSLTVLVSAERARDLVAQYAAGCGDVPWMVGGAAAHRLRRAVEQEGGHIAPEEPGTFVRLVELLTSDPARRS